MVPSRATTVRFPDDLWQVLEREAARDATSVAQLVRDATLMRLAFVMARERDEQALATIEAVAAGAVSQRRQRRAEAAGRDEMVTLPAPSEQRMAVLRKAGLLDSVPEPGFDRLARIAAQVLNAPVALVSLVSADEHTFKSCVGLPQDWADRGGLPITHSFCSHTVAAERPLIVGDAREHPLLSASPAIADLDAIAYAGVPLITDEGLVIGTLCVIDKQPRVWTRDQVGLLSDLAATVVDAIQSRIAGS
jgi:hypothetical protein